MLLLDALNRFCPGPIGVCGRGREVLPRSIIGNPRLLGPELSVLAVVLLATLLGTGAALWVLYSLLKPVFLASRALRD